MTVTSSQPARAAIAGNFYTTDEEGAGAETSFDQSQPIYLQVRTTFTGGWVCLTRAGGTACTGAKVPLGPLVSQPIPLFQAGSLAVGSYDILEVDSDGAPTGKRSDAPFSVTAGGCPLYQDDICAQRMQSFKAAATQMSAAMSSMNYRGLAFYLGGATVAGGAVALCFFVGGGITLGVAVAIGVGIAGVIHGTSLSSLIPDAVNRYNFLANDPPDPNFDEIAQPVFSTLTPPVDEMARRLFDAVDAQQAYGQAMLTSLERFQGAKLANDDAAAARQADAMAEYGNALADAIDTWSEALRDAATADGMDQPRFGPGELEAIKAFQIRVAQDGFTPAEQDSFIAEGMTASQIDELATLIEETDYDPAFPTQTRGEALIQNADQAQINVEAFRDFADSAAEIAVVLAGETNTAPEASFDATPESGDAPLTVDFESTSTDADGDTLTATWDFGDGNTATGDTPTHTYTTAGNYTVTLTVDDGSTTATASRQVTVTEPANAPPQASFTAIPTSGAAPLTVDFESTSTDADGDTLTATWDFGDGETATGDTPTHTYTTAGNYTVTLTVDDGHTSAAATRVIDVQSPDDNTPPEASFDATPTSGDAPLSVHFESTSTDADGDTLTATWDFGDGNTATGDTPTHTYTTAGNYTVTLTVDDGSTTATATRQITVAEPANAAPQASFTASPASGVVPLTVDFQSTSTDADGDTLTTTWDFGDGNGDVGDAPTHTYDVAGVYTVGLTVFDGLDYSTATRTIEVLAAPQLPDAVDDMLPANPNGVVDVLANDADTNGEALRVVASTAPAHGVVDCSALGSCFYRASNGYTGDDSFSYTVRNQSGLTASAEVHVNVQPLSTSSETLVADDDVVVSLASEPANFNLLENDSGAGALTVLEHSTTEHGSIVCDDAGDCTYQAVANFSGYDGFSYLVTESTTGGEATAFVSIAVAPAGSHLAPGAFTRQPGSAALRQGDEAGWGAAITSQPPRLDQHQLGALSPAGAHITFDGPHDLDPSSVRTARGWMATVASDGVQLEAGPEALLGQRKSSPIPRPLPPVSQGTGGDGHVPILVGTKVFAFYHHSNPTSVTCVDRATGRLCPGYPKQLGLGTTNINGPAVVVGSKIYTHLLPSSFYVQTAPVALYCWDGATDTSCGMLMLERIKSTGNPTASAPVLANGKMWLASESGRLHCVDPNTFQTCATPSFAIGIGTPGEEYDIVAHGSRVFAAGNVGRETVCFDTSTGSTCNGWSEPKDLGQKWNLVNMFTATGVANGVCAVATDSLTCVEDGNADTVIELDGWPEANDGYYNVTLEAEAGSRTLFGGLGRGGLGCWDWSTLEPCDGGGYTDGWLSYDSVDSPLPSAYGTAWDGACAVALGDPGQIFTVDPKGSSPCTSLSSGTDRLEIDLRDQRCDASVGAASWQAVSLTDVDTTSNTELASVKVIVRDAVTNETLITGELMGGVPLSLSTIDPNLHPAITVDANAEVVADSPAWEDGIPPRIVIDWNADPLQACFTSRTGVSAEQPSPATVSMEVVTETGGAASASRQVFGPDTPNLPPIAAFDSTTDGLEATFDAGASTDPDGTIVSYGWTFGDGATGTGADPVHVYGTAGRYTVTLRVTDNDGATASIEHDVEVSGDAPPDTTPPDTGPPESTPPTTEAAPTAVEGATITRAVDDTAVEPVQGTLPVTGARLIPLAAVALLLLGAGLVLTRVASRRSR